MKQNPRTYLSFKWLLGAVLTYNIGGFYFGYVMSYFTSISFPSMALIFGIDGKDTKSEGLFSGAVPFGALLGAIISSFIIKKWSRRESFLIVDIVAILANLIILIQSAETLLIGRVIQGLCIGIFTTLVPLMVKQISPIQLSGSFGALMYPCIGLGFFSSYLISYTLKRICVIQHFCWRITFGTPLAMIIVQFLLILLVFKNQTPKYLLIQNKIPQARGLLEYIYLPQNVNQILRSKQQDLQHGINNLNQGTELQEQNKSHNFDPQIDQTYRTNLQQPKLPSDAKPTIIFVCLLQAFHQLSGINVVVLYSAHLAKQAVPHMIQEIPLLINGIKIIAGLFGTVLLKKYGRRSMMLKGQGIILASLIGLFIIFTVDEANSIFWQRVIVICLLTFICSFVMTLGPITWVYISQVVQPNIIPRTTIINWALACIVITLFPIFQRYTAQIFLFFSGITLLNIGMCYAFMIETRNKTQIQIRELFQSNINTLFKRKNEK